MLDELRWTTKKRISAEQIKADMSPAKMPDPRNAVVRREPGLFGKENAQDRQHRDSLIKTHQIVVEIDCVEKGQAVISVSGRAIIVKAVEIMEASDQQVEPGTLAREVGEKLTEVDAQLMVQGHVAFGKHYIEDAIARITRRS